MRKKIQKQIKNVVDVVVKNKSKKQMLRFDFLQRLFLKPNTEKTENEDNPPKEEKELIPTYSKKKDVTNIKETKISTMQTDNGFNNTDNQESKLVTLDEIKSEVNLLKFPFFALSRQSSKKLIVIRYKDTITRGDERIDFSWDVSGNVEYGLPGVFDKKVFKAIEQIINQNGWSDTEPIQNPITFSLYQICKIIGKSEKSGKNRTAVKDALKRIQRTTINCQGAFYVKNKNKSLYDDSFYLYNRVVFKNEKLPDDSVAETNYLYLGDVYLESLNSFYVKKIDYKYYQGLRSNVARRLYEILDIKFYGMKKHSVKIEYKKLCALLPVVQQKYFSNAKWKLKAAHNELMALDEDDKPIPDKKKFLQAVKWSRINKFSKDWEIEYYPTKETVQKIKSEIIEVEPEPPRLEKPKEPDKAKQAPPLQEQPKEKIKLEPETIDPLTSELTKRNITKSTIPKLLAGYKDRYPDSDLADVLECFDHKDRQGEFSTAKNKAGLLVAMIKANDCEAQGYKSRAEQAKTKQIHKDRKRKQREQEEKEKQEAWGLKTDQEKFNHWWNGFGWYVKYKLGDRTKLDNLTTSQTDEIEKLVFEEIKTDSQIFPSYEKYKNLIINKFDSK